MSFPLGFRVCVGQQRFLATVVAWPEKAVGPNHNNRIAVVIDGSMVVTMHNIDEISSTSYADFIRNTVSHLHGPFTNQSVLAVMTAGITRLNVATTLSRMVKDKELKRISRGVYQNNE